MSPNSVLTTPPLDDAGARTADLFDWQASMAAADALDLYARTLLGDIPEFNLVCEWHEDWIVILGDQSELVSAKHREPATGPWKSISELVNHGGLGHLFARWLMLGGEPAARLVTSAALAAGGAQRLAKCSSEFRKYPSALASDHMALDAPTTACINEFAANVRKYGKDLPERWETNTGSSASTPVSEDNFIEACQFIGALAFDCDRPGRDLVGHAAPSLYALPIAKHFGHDEAVASAIWHSVLSLVRARMRNRGPAALGQRLASGPTMATPESSLQVPALQQRTATMRTIAFAVNFAIANPGALRPLSATPRTTRLGLKMQAGGCTDASIERAELLRRDFRSYERERRDAVPGSAADRQALDRYLLRLADETTSEVQSNESWGPLLWAGLAQKLDREPGPTDGLESDLALGAVADLTSKCRIWFGPRFDVAQTMLRASNENK